MRPPRVCPSRSRPRRRRSRSSRRPRRSSTGADYDTDWAARSVRALLGSGCSKACSGRQCNCWPCPIVAGSTAWPTSPMPSRRTGDLRRQPPQPRRHPAAAVVDPGAVAAQDVRRRRRRLLLHVARAVGRCRRWRSAPSRSSAPGSRAARPTTRPRSSTTAGAW